VTARCPICRKPSDSQSNSNFPFCSERCRLLDLGNWASEKYKISSPVFDESELEGEGEEARPSRDRGNREDIGNDARGRNR
jgi:uncharacterized protein